MSAREARLTVCWHPDVLAHDTGSGVFEAPPSELLEIQTPHPEGPERIRNMHAILRRGPVAPYLEWREGRHASDEEIRRFHTHAYLETLEAADACGRRFTPTTVMGRGSLKAIRAAAGTALAALGELQSGRTRMAFALVRPPGHHAAPGVADGYCFVNNVALAACTARAGGAARVAILDWDVHHGNGTQEGFYERDDVLTVSLHMAHGPWEEGSHPQTGGVEERGRGRGLGFNANVPLPMGATDTVYRAAFERYVAPRVREFAPELIIVALGLDANQFDPNGRQLVTMAGFRDLAATTRALADELCEGRLLIALEGGYNAAYAPFCLHASIEGFLGIGAGLADPLAYMPDDPARAQAVLQTLDATMR